MNFVLQPWHLVVTIFTKWMNLQQQKVIEFLRTENVMLRGNSERSEYS